MLDLDGPQHIIKRRSSGALLEFLGGDSTNMYFSALGLRSTLLSTLSLSSCQRFIYEGWIPVILLVKASPLFMVEEYSGIFGQYMTFLCYSFQQFVKPGKNGKLYTNYMKGECQHALLCSAAL